MTKVKICGITSLDDAVECVDAGADLLGFNFYAGSSRFISPGSAASIIRQFERPTASVGVFINEPLKRVVDAVRESGIGAIQLHGNESREYLETLRKMCDLPVIKAIRVKEGSDELDLQDWNADAILLDTGIGNEYGGTGHKFDWSIAVNVWDKVPQLYLAGGLTPGNVDSAVRQVRPFAVDVASGVETSPGKKDPKKVAAFIKAAKEAL